MQQPAPHPPVAMYFVQYIQPDQNNGQIQQQPQMVTGQPMPPMWGPYSQQVQYNGMGTVPVSYIQYPTYFPMQQVPPMIINQEPPRLAPVPNLAQSQPIQEIPRPPQGPHGPDQSHASIPGPVQPLKSSNAAPGPPVQPGRLPPMPYQPQLPAPVQPPGQNGGSDNALARFASVAALQPGNGAGGDKNEESGEPTPVRKRGRPRLHSEPNLETQTDQQALSQMADRHPSKRRNFAVPVDICLPGGENRRQSEPSLIEGSTNLNSPIHPQTSLQSSLIPGLPLPPRAVTNPVQVPESIQDPNGQNQGTLAQEQQGPHSETPDSKMGVSPNVIPFNNKVKEQTPIQDGDDDGDNYGEEEALADEEEVVWMNKDPVKRRKRPSNVFDEVLTMHPLYTAEGFACPECDKKFKFRKHCRRHMVNHSGSKPFKCPKCPRSYTRKDTCQRHAAACRILTRGAR